MDIEGLNETPKRDIIGKLLLILRWLLYLISMNLLIIIEITLFYYENIEAYILTIFYMSFSILIAFIVLWCSGLFAMMLREYNGFYDLKYIIFWIVIFMIHVITTFIISTYIIDKNDYFKDKEKCVQYIDNCIPNEFKNDTICEQVCIKKEYV